MDQEDSTLNPNGLIIQTPLAESNHSNDLPPPKKKRNLPGNPDPEAEVIALSPKTLMATNRFLCEICGKGFQRDQNLQLHRRGHNLPWKLKQRSGKEPRKRVYVCPEKSCVHNDPSRALGDLTGIKKHFCRKHGEKKWKCDKCSKCYAVHSDCKAHSKTCGTREYKCDCGTVFSRRDSFITHRAFCDALAEETARVNAASHFSLATSNGSLDYNFMGGFMASEQQQQEQNFTLFKSKEDNEKGSMPLWVSNEVIHNQQQLSNNSFYPCTQTLVSGLNPLPEQQLVQASESNYQNLNWAFGNSATKMCSNSTSSTHTLNSGRDQELVGNVPCLYSNEFQTSSSSSHMSATALLQKAAQIGSTTTDPFFNGGIKNNEPKNNVINSQMEMYAGAAKRRRILQSNEQINNQYHHYNQQQHNQIGGDGGQTRDFLGVGAVESICHPNSINGWD